MRKDGKVPTDVLTTACDVALVTESAVYGELTEDEESFPTSRNVCKYNSPLSRTSIFIPRTVRDPLSRHSAPLRENGSLPLAKTLSTTAHLVRRTP